MQKDWSLSFSALMFSLLIALSLTLLIVPLFYYVHEGGHIAVGLIGHLANNNLTSNFTITNWMNYSFLKLPQQTKPEGSTNQLFMFGGMIATVSVSLLAAILVRKYTKARNRRFVFLIPAIFFVYEIVGDFMCGTDNWTSKPLVDCSGPLQIFMTYLMFLLIPAIAFLFYPEVKDMLVNLKRKH